MYGIIIDVRVDPSREEEIRKMLDNMIIPKARTHKGITAGYWLRSLGGDVLRAVQLYDTKTNAQRRPPIRFNPRDRLLVHRSA